MDSDALLDASNVESGPNSPGSTSDSDAVNTSTSRVYFGPLQSAERRLTRTRDSLQHTPIHRALKHHTRSSLPVEVLQSDEGEGSSNDVMAFDLSRPDTPTLADDALEEPPSALATKVLRAWDNPSPPPSPHASSRALREDEVSSQLATDTGPSRADSDAEMDSGGPSEPDVATAANEQPPLLPREETDEMDLINFDSFTTALPTDPPPVQLEPATPPQPSQGILYSVDDLLAPTPLHPSQGLDQNSHQPFSDEAEVVLIPALAGAPSREGTASGDEEAQVLVVLSDEPTGVPAPSTLQAFAENVDMAPTAATLLEPAPQTPLRRSTRPRRSVSPYVLPLTSPSKLPDSTQLSPSQPKVEVGPARRKKSKARELDDGKVDLGEISQNPTDRYLADIVLEDVEPPLPTTPLPLTEDKGKGKQSDLQQQRLGSLSPTSTNLLMQLLPTEPAPGPTSGGADVIVEGQPSAAQRPASPAVAVPASVGTPVRPSTPSRNDMSSQPTRDVTRTPARRVPISQAMIQGVVSPVKSSGLQHGLTSGTGGFRAGVLGAPVFKPRALEDSLRSPAKRVPVTQAMLSLQSPGKPSARPALSGKPSHLRSSSEDPVQPAVPKVQRSMSVEPARPGHTSLQPSGIFKKPASSQSTSALSSYAQNESSTSIPPLNLPPSIQELDEHVPQGQVQPPKPASGLRPPIGKIESKIPRPGTKPYVRPSAASTAKQISKPTTTLPQKTVTAASAPPVARPMRMVRKVVTKPVEVSSSSDDNPTQAVAGPGPRTVASRIVKPPTTLADDMGTPKLKRKRDTEESRASPAGVRPVVLVRKVASVPKAAPKPSSSSPSTRASPARSPGPTAVQGKIRMRKVVDKKKPKSPPRSSPRHEPMDIVHSPPAARAPLQPSPPPPIPTREQTADAPTDTTNLPPPIVPAAESETPESAQPTVLSPPGSFQPDINIESETEPSYGLRRTTRSRKSAQSTTDVFGTVAAPHAPSRRRPTLVLSDNSVFSGMTALALKSLTTTNTQRNQRQVAEIQMEVVIMEGKRPDSPTTKVRTSLERQREERVLQRQERAERRARRSAGEGESLDADAAEQSGAGDVSMDGTEEEEVEGPLLRHRRGAGEDEDYETPEKPERPAKRTRVDDGQIENSDSKTEKNEKRVKWDRGLATTVYLDDAPPNPKRHPNDVIPKRGVLAPSAKKLPLDTMGNVLNADAPIIDVRPENIVVKKFVYEDDDTAMPEPPPPPPPPKPTRSKAKKPRS